MMREEVASHVEYWSRIGWVSGLVALWAYALSRHVSWVEALAIITWWFSFLRRIGPNK